MPSTKPTPVRREINRLDIAIHDLSLDRSEDSAVQEAFTAGMDLLSRLNTVAGAVQLLEDLLDEDFLSGQDARALQRLYRRLTNPDDDGGPVFRLRRWDRAS